MIKRFISENFQTTVFSVIVTGIIAIAARFFLKIVQYYYWLPYFTVYSIPKEYYKYAEINKETLLLNVAPVILLIVLAWYLFRYIFRKLMEVCPANKLCKSIYILMLAFLSCISSLVSWVGYIDADEFGDYEIVKLTIFLLCLECLFSFFYTEIQCLYGNNNGRFKKLFFKIAFNIRLLIYLSILSIIIPFLFYVYGYDSCLLSGNYQIKIVNVNDYVGMIFFESDEGYFGLLLCDEYHRNILYNEVKETVRTVEEDNVYINTDNTFWIPKLNAYVINVFRINSLEPVYTKKEPLIAKIEKIDEDGLFFILLHAMMIFVLYFVLRKR